MNDKEKMPDVFTIGLFYAPAPMSEYHYGTMDERTKMKPENKAHYTRTQAIVELLEGMRKTEIFSAGNGQYFDDMDAEAYNQAINDAIKAIKEMG